MEQPRMDSPIDAGPLVNGDGQQCFAAFEGPLPSPEALASDCTKADVLLLTWVLVLSRYVDISDIEFTWGYSINDGAAVETALSAADLPFKADDSIGSLLEAVKSARQRTLPDTESVCATGETLFFTNSKDWTLKVAVTTQDGTSGLQATWRTLFMTSYLANRHLESALTILSTLTTTTILSTPISSLLTPTPSDLTQIWHWNRHLPPTIPAPIHTLITSRASTHPHTLAIDAWDGRWTYAEVDSLSTQLAKHLRALGLGANCIVPLCFEKSRWTVIAVLAVMKTGAAFTLTDPSQPLARLQTIAETVDARYVLTSARHAGLGEAMAAAGAVVVPVCAETFEGENELLSAELPAQVPLDALMYVIFTSGSTGKPKGVMLSHGAYGSGTLPRAAAVGYDEISRVLDFASYAFDVAIDSMLATLSHGGCLCIPSDAERLNDLSGFIRRAKVTMANLTPSVARILDADIVPGLRSLGVGGEAVTASDVAVWGKSTRVVNGYGPSEVGVGCTTNHSAATGRPYVSIGPGTGGVMWIVDREDHEKLVPVGAVGELLVEGPCVGEGYMGDPEKTAAAFVVDPPWLTAGFGDVEGRTGRVYKTGDLVKYDPDGSGYLVFVGRKDTQVKLRGQRVELGEVEYHLRAQLPARVRVAAEVIKPEGPGKQPMLVAFISDPETETTKDRDAPVERIPFSAEVAAIMSEMDDRLKAVLPKYMVPAAYIPINHMPALVSGKTDRKVLRQVGATIVLQDLDKSSTSVGEIQEPTTPAETSLRKTWSRIFNLPEAEIGINHSFFALGGDSVLAMKLAAAAREDGLTLNVADIFSNPKLSAMASVAKETTPAAEQDDVAPFSLIDPAWDATAARTEAAELCGVDVSAIEDIYPCTPLQEVLMAFTARSTKSFVAQRIAEIPDEEATAARLVSAWDAAAATSPILRTRVVQFRDHGLLQVVVREPIAWHTSASSLSAYIAAEQAAPMGLGTPLSRWALIRDEEESKHYFVWTIHHALYDGFSTPLLLERVARAWRGEETQRPSQMKHFVAHLTHGISRPAAQDYWRRALSGATGPQFPALPSRSYLPAPDALVERFIPLHRPSSTTSTIMPSTLIRAAWALVAAQHAGGSGDGDVVFGETMSGRASVPIAGAEQLEGPLIATVPVRVRVERGAPVGEFLLRVQEEGFARMAFEHVGMQHIRRVSADAQIACEVKVGLVIQPGEIEEKEDEDEDDGPPKFRGTDAAREALHFNSYPLMLVCSLRRDGFLVMASFDSKLVAVPLMERVLAQFETAVQQLAKEEPVSVGEISLLTEQDREQIWQWNRTPPAGVDQATPRLVAGHVTAGDPYPSVVVPWIVDPANAERLMPIGTVGELVVEGPLASVDFIQDPTWLVQGSSSVPGRPGQVHRTGDLVKYSADGAILFVAKKESQTKLQGRAVDLAEVDRYLESLLPESTWVSAHIITPGQSQEPMLVAYVEARAQDDSVNLVKLELTEDELPAFVATSLPANLAERLLGLNKALSDLLPPYMIPGAYIPLKEMPLKPGEVDRAQLDTISSHLSQDAILKLRTAFTQLRAKGIDSKPWTTKERKLQKLWAQFLGIDPSNIDRDDSFFRLGGDSILAMRLVSAARQVGFKLSVANVFRRMRLSDMAAALEETDAAPVESKTFAPFSALDDIEDIDAFLAQEIQPALADPSWKIADVLPVTDAQARDIAATIDPACRSAVQYTMLYLPHTIDRARLLACCQQLVDHHEILRTIFVQHGNRFLQVILESLTAPVIEVDAPEDENDIEAYANRLFAADIDTAADDLALGAPFLKLFYIASAQEHCLTIRLSHAQYDGVSLPELIRQVELLYAADGNTAVIPTTPSFSTYIHALAASRTTHHAASLAHWRAALAGSQLTPTHPALSSATSKTARSAFTQRAVDVSARPADVTPATLLSTAWALVLAQRHGVRDVVFGGVGTGRGVEVDGLGDAAGVVGPCYGFVPIRVRFDSETAAQGVLRRVQEERARGVAFERVGFAELVEECGLRGSKGWEGREWFESIVHHQDVDDFDEMPFAGGTARVEIANPHPERAWPVRVVSFVRGGKFWYGIQADEGRMDVAEELLGEVCEAVERLLARPDEPLF
ncbi:putative nonribosomal peptide synthase protein [Lasiodiplodia theobromae]|uniref:Nonribosomal peptide synthase protein n=1 Tax=Lasiodiplodia theobromae TaxID=45133 RepID=A0A8H7IRZ7_9PEZI|nr:putative nonribosomal peptide synthase protein [Lasiodiplodia theobromae]